MLTTELHLDRIPALYRRFADEIGEGHWKKVAANLRQEIKGNEFLGSFLEREFAVVLQLEQMREHLARHGRLPAQPTELRPLYPAAAFMAQVLSLLDSWPRGHAEKLCRRVYGALKNPADLRGLQLEFTVATHFARRGWRISWPETLEVKGETFDHLMDTGDGTLLEVECKSIGDDKGRKMTRREVLEFYKLLQPHIKPTTSSLTKGLSVVATLSLRIRTSHKDRVELAKGLARAIFLGASTVLPGGVDIRISDFDSRLLGDAPHLRAPREMRTAIDGVTATKNLQAVLVGNGQGGVLALALQSSRDDQFLKATFDTLSDAASRQLTGLRGGLLVAALDGIGGAELGEVARDDNDPQHAPSALRLATSKFLGANHRDHVIGLAFFSRTGLQPVEHGLVDASSGTAYYFPKRESPFWSDSFSGVFATNA